MADEEAQQDFSKLDTEERLKHKNWKARVSAYEELTKTFAQAEPDDGEFKKFAGKLKDFVQDSNAAAQEKGLEAALAFVDNVNPALAGKVCGDVVAGIITKCLTARPKTREKAIEITMLYVELEKHEATLEELLKGLTNKSPKIVSACAVVIRDALRMYGSKYISIKLVLKTLHPLLADRDKSVRDEAKALIVEVYRWTGEAIKPQLLSVQPVLLAELETEFEKLKGTKAAPEKLVRSEQARAARVREDAENVTEAGSSGDKVEDEPEETKAEDLFDPVEVLKNLPEDFNEKVQSKKWQERKEALDTLDKVSDHPKLMEGDYNEVISNLKKIIAKDSNVVVVATAGKCLTNLAKGIKQKFGQCAHSCVSVIIEKFKEKKANVVATMREAIDACFLSLTLETITEDLIEGLSHKTPSVKSETALFLNRCFCKCNPEDLPKKLLKVFVEALIKNTNDPDASVRDSACEAIGTALKVVGEKALGPFVADLDELKMKKVKEYCDKAVITAPRRKAVPVSTKTEQPAKVVDAKNVKKPVARPATKPAAKPPVVSKPPSEPDESPDSLPDTVSNDAAPKKSTIVGKGKAAPKAKTTAVEDSGPNITVLPKGKKQRENDEKLLKVLKWTFQTPTKEFVLQLKDQMTACFSANLVTWMFGDDFKNHIKSIQALQDDLQVSREPSITVLDLILKWFSLRFFDTNPQVLVKALEYLQLLFKKLNDDPPYQLTDGESSCFVPFLLIKIGDPKDAVRKDIRHVVRQLCCLTAFTKIYGYLADGMKSKNAKQRTECIDLATWTMETYGMDACVPSPQVALKLVAQQIGDRDASVRNAALNNLLYAYQLVGDKLFKFIAPMSEKDRSMLEERIKRAPKKAAAAAPPPATPKSGTSAVRPDPRAKVGSLSVAVPLDVPDIADSASDSGTSTNSKGSKAATEAPAVLEKDEQQQRPSTVTLRRTAPTLIPVSAQDLQTVMSEVTIPKLSQSAAASAGGITSLFSGVLSNNTESSLQALKKIDDLVSKSVVDPAVSSNLSELYRHLSDVLKKLYASSMPNYATNYSYIASCYGHVLHILRVLFENPRHADQTNALVLSDLINNLISVILDRRMEAMHGGLDIVKNANVITLRIVDNANRTQIICASVCLLRQLLGSGQMSDRFLDLVIKCVWRCVRKMPDTILQLQVDPILLEVHLFLRQFPASYWQTAADDTPFRTVKTILYTLSKMYGSEILSHLTLVEDAENSELMSFLKRVAKTLERDGPGGDHQRQTADSREPGKQGNLKKHEETLSTIVQKVGSSDDKAVQQGLRELYEYKEAHGINLDAFMERTSGDFQKFVSEGLRMIEFEQKDLGLPDAGLSEKGQAVITRLKGVISSPFFTAQDIEDVKRMANEMKLEIRAGCFMTATQRVEAAFKAAEAQAYKSENMGSPSHRPPSILSPSRAMRPTDDNSGTGKAADNLDAVKARVKAYLQNKGT